MKHSDPSEISHLIEKIDAAGGPALLRASQTLLELAEKESRHVCDINTAKPFLERWYGTKPGIFWLVWQVVSLRGRAAVIWSSTPLRKLLLLPAEEFIQLGIMADNKDQVGEIFDLLRNYFEIQTAVVDDQEKKEIVRQLWEGRQGIPRLISDAWLKKSPVELRPEIGAKLNWLRSYIQAALERLPSQVDATHRADVYVELPDALDLTVPGLRHRAGVRKQAAHELLLLIKGRIVETS